MQQGFWSGDLVVGEQGVNAVEAQLPREDDLGFAAALRFAVPAGLLLWALGIWGVLHFIA